MFKNLIEYNEVQEMSPELMMFEDVTFLRDFGPWKAGDKVPLLAFQIESSVCESYAEDGATVTNIYIFSLQ